MPANNNVKLVKIMLECLSTFCHMCKAFVARFLYQYDHFYPENVSLTLPNISGI